jgi:Anaerobic dehydrogenases, typically selenocysteine-containing
MAGPQRRHVHLTHWGAAEIESDGRRLTSVRPWREDPAPSRILENLAAAHRHPARIDQPYIRQGWLEHGPGAAARGSDVFVPVSWTMALDLLAGELRRVYGSYGPDGVFGGSYGWASAGRFHHAQSQLHRFLNCLGGYVRSVNNYSFGTSRCCCRTWSGTWAWSWGAPRRGPSSRSTPTCWWRSAGCPRRTPPWPRAASAGTPWPRRWRPPWRADAGSSRSARCAPTPTPAWRRMDRSRARHDAALMLALCHVLDSEGLADRRFLDRYTVGYPRFAAYLHGDADGVPKTPAWAAALTGIAAERIRTLARQMAAGRTLVTVSWSLQRAEHGEQPVWLGLVLAAMLGQIGLPGGGFGHGYGSTGDVGLARRLRAASAPGRERHRLLHPGGQDRGHAAASRRGLRLRRAAPPLPGCQARLLVRREPVPPPPDLARLREAFARPQTVVVHDPFWTATARHADIVLPSTMSVERDDIGAAAATPPCSPCRSSPNRTRKPATTTPSSVPWRTGCRWGRLSPRAERSVSGCLTSTSSGART